MATENITRPLSDTIKKLDKTYDEINKGQTADGILRLLDPLMDDRLGQLLGNFGRCAPDLGSLLQLQAQIGEVWRIRNELKKAKQIGASAERLLEAITAK